jgi:hypothetical protein
MTEPVATIAQPVDDRGATRTGRSRLCDTVFAAFAAGTFVYYLIKSSGVVIKSDDWLFAFRGNSFVDYFRPYESNVSILPIAVYHFVYTVFGFGTYWPLRVIGVASQIVVACAVFFVVRSRWGSPAALVAGVAVLWFPGTLLIPSQFNHWLALAASILAAWALTQPPGRSDWVVAGALVFALSSSGVGVAAAAGCVVYVALTRAPLRRWLAVGVPTALFVVWWFTLARGDHGSGLHTSAVDTVRYTRDGIFSSLQLLSPGNRWLGITLAIAFAAWIGWRLRKGPRAAAHELAWTCAVGAWWLGLALTRGPAGAGSPDSFRYRLVTFGLIAVAVLPLSRSPHVRRLLHSPKAVPVALCAAFALVALNGPAIAHHADTAEAKYRQQVQKMIVLNLGPGVIPDNATVRFDIYTTMTARAYRGLIDKYGAPPGTRPRDPDAAIVSLGPIKPVLVNAAPATCTALHDPSVIQATADSRSLTDTWTNLVLRAGPNNTVIQVRRFQSSWVTIGEIGAGSTARIDLPVLMTKTPWMLRAPGACEG